MSSQLNHLAQEDLDSTTDEDFCLSLKVKQLETLKCHFSENVPQTLEKTTIRRLDFGGLVKLTPFQRQLAETAASTKSDLPESKIFLGHDSHDSLKGSPAKIKARMFPEGILKSDGKSKYIKWHQYLTECKQKGISLSLNESSEMNFVAPYFMKGNEDHWEHWDNNKWIEEEQWWEDDQWVVSSPTYAKYKETDFTGYSFGNV